MSALLAGVALGACADSEPPDFIAELGAPTTVATAAPTTSTTATTLAAGGSTTTSATASTPVTDLVVGDCVTGAPFAGDPAAEATDAQVVDCAGAHDGEVVGLVTHPQGPSDPYPGQEQVASYAEEQCAIAFEAYVGTPYGESPLSMLSLWPTEDSWARGDRESVCVAFQEGTPLTGSLAGAGAGA